MSFIAENLPQVLRIHDQLPIDQNYDQLQQQQLQAQLHQDHIQAQVLFRQKQLLAQKQQPVPFHSLHDHEMLQETMFQTPWLLPQQQLRKQQIMQQRMAQQQILQQRQCQSFHQAQESPLGVQEASPYKVPQPPQTPLRTPRNKSISRSSSTLPTPMMNYHTSPAPSSIAPSASIGSLSSGNAVLRILEFIEQLNPNESDRASDMFYWDGLMKKYLTDRCIVHWQLIHMENDEKATYDMDRYTFARFFDNHYLCGVTSIKIAIDKTIEITTGEVMEVDCPDVSIMYRYNNGTTVISTGLLNTQFVATSQGLKMRAIKFTADTCEELVTRKKVRMEPIASKRKIPAQKLMLPDSLIGEWGVPKRVFETIQICHVMLNLHECMFYANVTGSSAVDSLNAVALSKKALLAVNQGSEQTNIKRQDLQINEEANQPSNTPPILDLTNSPIVKTQDENLDYNPLHQAALAKQAEQHYHRQRYLYQQFQIQQQQQQQQQQIYQFDIPEIPHGYPLAYQQAAYNDALFSPQYPQDVPQVPHVLVSRKRSFVDDSKPPAARKRKPKAKRDE